MFEADRNLGDDSGATRTRQNRQGTRYGYECPEERDYYPYWHPTPWTDIAVLTSTKTNCEFYKEQSFNNAPKSECVEYYSATVRRVIHYDAASLTPNFFTLQI